MTLQAQHMVAPFFVYTCYWRPVLRNSKRVESLKKKKDVELSRDLRFNILQLVQEIDNHFHLARSIQN